MLKLFTVVCTCVYYDPTESVQDSQLYLVVIQLTGWGGCDKSGPSDSLLDPCLVYLQQQLITTDNYFSAISYLKTCKHLLVILVHSGTNAILFHNLCCR
jgi:hypothetical protein